MGAHPAANGNGRVRRMPRDETVCKYCGISYLILHEFKDMEEKMKAMEKEMKFYQGSVEREKKLQEKLQSLSQDFQGYKSDSESKTERIEILSKDLKNQQEELQRANEKLKCFEEKLEVAHKQAQHFSKTLDQHQLIMKEMLLLLPSTKSDLARIKNEVSNAFQHWTSLKGDIFLQLQTISEVALTEISKLKKYLAECQSAKVCLEDEVKDLKLSSDVALMKTQQIQTLLQKENELQSKCLELQKETLGLHSQVEAIGLKFHEATAEMDDYKKLLLVKSKEIAECQRELKKLEFETRISESRHTRELKEKEGTLLVCQQMCKQLQEEVAEKERQQENLKRRTSCSENELEMMKALLSQTEEEVVTLKKEREMLLISHQNRIEELRDNFSQKMIYDCREKIEFELIKDRAQHSAEFEEQILQLKEEAKLELNIEKQKHQELITKYQREQEELQKKISSLISNATNDLKREVTILEKKLQDSQVKLVEKGEAKEKEIQSLKRVIAEFDLRLKREIDSGESVRQNLKREMKQKTDELERVAQEQMQLKEKFNQAEEEKSFLQETVRRECEERYELTEALSQAKQQLLELKKLSGSFPLSPCSQSQGNLTSSTAVVNNHGERKFANLNSGKGSQIPGLPGVKKPSDSAASNKPRSHGSLALPSLPSPYPPMRRASSDQETRRRIATIVRRWSQQ
ncbi:leucine-, glutamate- and lysine-rich protein 1 isoform X2 [Tachyglossus aculeatus]|uniref:leucine-, glutamate- and lysine-rich protein 1 isoform X2 n=1 Tax=Tachyglossus aculeatus TaxID=9261 RepID=UPI0018F4C562|nr:leucine-, glutamate- and lysine-rich protein 1 isoform X2 [Tachyglossus aculeatus]